MARRQYKREPLADDEVDRLTNACETFLEKLVVLTLLDTGVRVSELTTLKKNDIQWQERRLKIRGKGGPYGKQTKLRVIAMTERARRLIEHHYTMEDEFPVGKRQAERIVKDVANRA